MQKQQLSLELEKIKQEHEQIERELLELEEIINQDEINFSNLSHVWVKLLKIWEEHEEKEETIFPELTKHGFRIQITTLHFEHVALRSHKNNIIKAFKSGNNEEIKKVLHTDMNIIIAQLRNHIEKEEMILYSVFLD